VKNSTFGEGNPIPEKEVGTPSNIELE